MIIRRETCTGLPKLSSFAPFTTEDVLFFDIETTGLNHKRSHLYLITALFYESDTPVLIQWFAQRPSEEAELCRCFLALAATKKVPVHYNGTTFDIPYLKRKCEFYGLDPAPLETTGVDLFRDFRRLKKIFQLPDGKLKTIEKLSGYRREDPFDGGELIDVYQKYCQCGDEELSKALFLHNREDVLSLLYVQLWYHVTALWTESVPRSKEVSVSGPLLTVRADFGEELPPCSLHTGDGITFTMNGQTVTAGIPLITGEKKFYFDDYKNYIYLPREDRAVHKSVGIYVEKEYREKATRTTAYERHTGSFLPVYDKAFVPVFRDAPGVLPAFIRYEKPEDVTNLYLRQLTAYLMK